ncbi:zinc finger protein 675 isoform X1 [Drosophila busckii]|nr:zinc finger protein 675 isoform X1 [Drosophila busckii]
MNFQNLELIEDAEQNMEVCRTCGIYYMYNTTHMTPIFQASELGAVDGINGCEMSEVVQQMNEWNLGVNPDDGRSQQICSACTSEFKRLLKFKRCCLEAQVHYDQATFIKKEIDMPKEQSFCGFVYLDSDEESGEDDGSQNVWAPFDIPHVPIKEEHTARVPLDMPSHPSPALLINRPEAAFLVQNVDKLQPIIQEKANKKIYKFTYEDDVEINDSPSLPAPKVDTSIYCKLCGQGSKTLEQHTEHMNNIHLLKNCECHICGKKFTNVPESRIRYHIKWHRLQNHLKCPICGFFCNSRDTLNEHKLAVHSRTKCDFCGKQILNKQLQAHFNRHIRENEEELARTLVTLQPVEIPQTPSPEIIQLECAFCDSIFDNSDKLEAHVLATHKMPKQMELAAPQFEPGQQSYQSENTPMSINKLVVSPLTVPEVDSPHSTLSDEKLENLLEQLYQAENLSLQINEPTVCPLTEADCLHSNSPGHPTDSKTMYKCHICGKSFNLKIKLNRHIKLHTKAPF